MALVRRRRKRSTTRGGKRKTARRAYMRSNGTKKGGRRKSARRAYMRSNGTKKGGRRKSARRAYMRSNPAKKRKTKRKTYKSIRTHRGVLAYKDLAKGYRKKYRDLVKDGHSQDVAGRIVAEEMARRSTRGRRKGSKKRRKKTAKWVPRARRLAKTKAKRTKKNKVWGGRGKRAIASASLTARAAHRRKRAGNMGAGEAKFLRATGLKVRRNPSFAGTMGDLKTLAPTILATGAAVVGFSVIGMKASAMIAPKITGAPAVIRENILPITTGVLTAVAWTALKQSRMSKWSMPVLLGGMSAALLQLLMTSKIGQTIAAKVGYPVKLADASDITETSSPDQIAAAAQTEELKGLGAYAPEWGLGSYVPVSQYMGSYVDAGPQEAFGEYMASNYPVHSPGPGDNASVHGRIISDKTISGYSGLGDYDYTTQESGIYDNRIPSVDNSLLNTPGGTIITGGEFEANTASGEMLGEGVFVGSDRW